MKVVGLTGDTVEICLSPNKTNIKLVACKIPNEVEMAMSWLVNSLQEYRDKFPRTIVYSTSININISQHNYHIVHLMSKCTTLKRHRKTKTPLLKRLSIEIAL